jgi:hypothetical protein
VVKAMKTRLMRGKFLEVMGKFGVAELKGEFGRNSGGVKACCLKHCAIGHRKHEPRGKTGEFRGNFPQCLDEDV